MREAGLDSGNFWYYDHSDVDGLYALGLTDNVLKADAPPMQFLTVTTLKDPSKMHSGHHTCESFAFVGYEAFEKWAHTKYGERPADYAAMKEDLAWRMVKGLDKRVPGLSKHIVFWDLGTPLTNVHYLNATRVQPDSAGAGRCLDVARTGLCHPYSHSGKGDGEHIRRQYRRPDAIA